MVDFIDMAKRKHRRAVEAAFLEAAKHDRAQVTFLPISPLGVMEVARERLQGNHAGRHVVADEKGMPVDPGRPSGGPRRVRGPRPPPWARGRDARLARRGRTRPPPPKSARPRRAGSGDSATRAAGANAGTEARSRTTRGRFTAARDEGGAAARPEAVRNTRGPATGREHQLREDALRAARHVAECFARAFFFTSLMISLTCWMCLLIPPFPRRTRALARSRRRRRAPLAGCAGVSCARRRTDAVGGVRSVAGARDRRDQGWRRVGTASRKRKARWRVPERTPDRAGPVTPATPPSGERAGNDGAGTVASGTVWQTHEVLAAMNDTDFASAVQRAVTSHRKIFVHQERKWAAVRLRENLMPARVAAERARQGLGASGRVRARAKPARSPRPPASRARASTRDAPPLVSSVVVRRFRKGKRARGGRARGGAAVGASRGAASRGQRAAVHLVPVLRGHERAPARRGAPAASVRRPGGRDARGERRGGRGVRRVGRRRGNARESSDADDGEHL